MKSWLLLFTLLWLGGGNLCASSIEVRQNYNDPLGKSLSYLEDEFGELTFEEALEQYRLGNFTQSINRVPNFGFTGSTYWVRLALKNSTQKKDELFLEYAYPLIDHLNYFEFHAGAWAHTETGDAHNFFERPILHRNFVFPILLQAGEEKEIFFRLESRDTVQLPLYLWHPSKFFALDHDQQLIYGIYFGLMIVMLVFNLLLFALVKERVYFFYAAYLLSFTLVVATLTGFSFEYLWPNWPEVAKLSRPLCINLTIISISWFIKDLLSLKEHLPKYNRQMNLLIILAGVGTALSLVGLFQIAIIYGVLLSIPAATLAMLIGILRYRQGYTPARLFLVGWSFLLLGIVLYCLKALGLLQPGFFINNAMLFGTVVEVILLATALSDRVFLLKQEKDKAFILLAEHSDKLEETVTTRTKHLNRAIQSIESSLVYAQRIQTSLLPNQESISQHFASHSIIWKPKDLVGGDIYLVSDFEDGINIALFDCTGHGVPGALMTMISTTGLWHIMDKENRSDPGLLLQRLNQFIKDYLHQHEGSHLNGSNDGLEGGICWLEKETHLLHYAGARLPITYWDQDLFQVIRGSKQEIGYRKNKVDFTYENNQIQLKLGDRFYLYSDGLLDQMGGAKNLPFGRSRIIGLLEQHAQDPMRLQINKLFQGWQDYQDKGEQIDDVTLLGFEI